MPTPIKIASRLDPIKPSITRAVTAKAAKLTADGVDVVSLAPASRTQPGHIKARVRRPDPHASMAVTSDLRRATRIARRSR